MAVMTGSASVIRSAVTLASASVLRSDHRPPEAPRIWHGHDPFDLGPIAAVFLIIAVMWLIAAVACGRDDR
jgi:hypothetical protein